MALPLLVFIYRSNAEGLWFLCVRVSGIVAALASYWWTIACYRCSECGRIIGDMRTRPSETPIVFRCSTCDVDWDTGVRAPPDNSGGGGDDIAAGCD